MCGPNKLGHYTTLDRKDLLTNHSSLLGPSKNYRVNKMLNTAPVCTAQNYYLAPHLYYQKQQVSELTIRSLIIYYLNPD